jgi:lysozyme
MRVLRFSSPLMHGPDVVEIQERLRAHGLQVAADGFFGQQTRDAVRRFQREACPPVDGIVGDATRAALAKRPDDPQPGVEDAVGPDVSVHQGDVDWKKVAKAGASFAIVKATEGRDFRDKTFSRARWKAIKAAGLARGAYHFARPSGEPGDAVEEARDFHAAVQDVGGLQPGDLPYALDLEVTRLSPGATHEWMRRFVHEVRRLSGHLPLVYTSPSFWHDRLGGPAEHFGCELWIAHYEVARPAVPAAWRSYAMWQHTQSGELNGVKGKCDLNRMPGGQVALARLAVHA